MESYGWLLDAKRCIECRACESACKQWNKVEIGVGVRRRQVRIYELGTFPVVRQQALSGGCNHCENAWCMKVCPVKAISRREDGIILIDQNKCVGCQQCAAFCPYSAPQFNLRTRKMDKCTMCVDRVDAGLQPACATLCPTGALQWGPWSELSQMGSETIEKFANPELPSQSAAAGGGSATVEVFTNPNQTRPRIRFINDAFPVGK